MKYLEVKIDMRMPNNIVLCPYCLGSGKQKAMQRAMAHNGESVRVADTTVQCNHCKGKGMLTK